MLKNILILCLTIIFSVSISEDNFMQTYLSRPSQVSVEMEPMTCEDADMVMTRGLNNFEPEYSWRDELASACCKICTKGTTCGNSFIQKSKTCHRPRKGLRMRWLSILFVTLLVRSNARSRAKPVCFQHEKSVGAKTTEGEIRSISFNEARTDYRIRPFGTWTQDVTGDYFLKRNWMSIERAVEKAPVGVSFIRKVSEDSKQIFIMGRLLRR